MAKNVNIKLNSYLMVFRVFSFVFGGSGDDSKYGEKRKQMLCD